MTYHASCGKLAVSDYSITKTSLSEMQRKIIADISACGKVSGSNVGTSEALNFGYLTLVPYQRRRHLRCVSVYERILYLHGIIAYPVITKTDAKTVTVEF